MPDTDMASTGEVATLIGLDPTRVAKIAQLIPPMRSGNGRGTRALYSAANILEVQIVDRLWSFGLPHRTIRGVMDKLRHSDMRWLEQQNAWLVIIDAERWMAGNSLVHIIRSLNYPSTFLVIDIGQMKKVQ